MRSRWATVAHCDEDMFTQWLSHDRRQGGYLHAPGQKAVDQRLIVEYLHPLLLRQPLGVAVTDRSRHAIKRLDNERPICRGYLAIDLACLEIGSHLLLLVLE
ncbi:hypothetical protein VA603_13945 [Stenotrophomonas sp. MH1]|uniref:Uncharacterized protein n=1 Tax=Stenotrophomonas capsici TaxID=3110230 RepID=A0ABU5V805_9GAMM|nr:hypothetical protein [Stenotrophomonas sp. MH1]MEA5668645.1 hypothetical protein [Stenotrophomonas sp. MH1]